jgi:hypothetical protein
MTNRLRNLIVLFIIFYYPTSYGLRFNPKQCIYSSEALVAEWGSIQEKSFSHDVRAELNVFFKEVQICKDANRDVSIIKTDDATVQIIVQQGIASEIDVLKKKIANSKSYEAIYDLDKLRAFSLVSDKKIELAQFLQQAEIELPKRMAQRNSLSASIMTQQLECKNYDFRAELPPVRDQDTIGWCYAYAAADLLSQNSHKNISAIGLAAQYNIYKKADFNAPGGHIQGALKEAKFACVEEDLPSYVQNVQQIGKVMTALQDFSDFTFLENKPTEAKCVGQLLSPYLPNLMLSEIEKILVETNRNEIIETLLKKDCKEKIFFTESMNLSHHDSWSENYSKIQTIQEGLQSGKIIGIEVYLSGFLRDPNEITHNKHAMSVVGQKRNANGQCVYIVRNSWGKLCAPFNLTKLECDPTSGYLEIPVGSLLESIYKTTVLK